MGYGLKWKKKFNNCLRLSQPPYSYICIDLQNLESRQKKIRDLCAAANDVCKTDRDQRQL